MQNLKTKLKSVVFFPYYVYKGYSEAPKYKKRLFFLSIAGGIYGAYYINDNYLRKFKGIRKLRQRFKAHESDDIQLYLGQFGYFNLLNKFHKTPIALILPKTDDEVEKIVYFCNKYRLGIHLTEESEIEKINNLAKEKPYIALNPKYLKTMEFNESTETFTIGSGVTSSEIDQFAQQHGYCFPYRNAIKNYDNTDLLHHLNHDEITFKSKDIASMKYLVNNLTVVLPNATRLKTGTDITKSGLGLNLTELFIGVKGGLGIITEANMTLPKLHKKVYDPIFLELKPESDLYTLLVKLREAYQNLDAAQVNLISGPQGNFLEVHCEKTIQGLEIQKLLSRSSSQLLRRLNQKDEKARRMHLRIPKGKTTILGYKIGKMLEEELHDYNYELEIDLLHGDVLVELPSKLDFKKIEYLELKLIKALVNEDCGIFVNHSDRIASNMYKNQATLFELGRNNQLQYLRIKHMLDLYGIMYDEKLVNVPLNSFGEQYAIKSPRVGS